MQIFTLREEIDDLDPSDHTKRDALLANLNSTLNTIEQDLHEAIAQKDKDGMAREAVKLQYWGKMITEIQAN